jgi:hypothetical protein
MMFVPMSLITQHALMMVNSLRMQATRATLAVFPASRKRV